MDVNPGNGSQELQPEPSGALRHEEAVHLLHEIAVRGAVMNVARPLVADGREERGQRTVPGGF